ncbi:hypothetical protein niasHT_027084 [Heterodera trifolii]|uniref:Histone H1 n=1 Tax=Heterodera trifolii TaxID=157864 RepID=A0ABD2JGF0_9BILA
MIKSILNDGGPLQKHDCLKNIGELQTEFKKHVNSLAKKTLRTYVGNGELVAEAGRYSVATPDAKNRTAPRGGGDK